VQHLIHLLAPLTCFAIACVFMQDAVTVVGYPIGGDTMSVTSGVVSRIEVTSYVHGAAELLGIQIDAAVSKNGTNVES
jgi:hypothetical protein